MRVIFDPVRVTIEGRELLFANDDVACEFLDLYEAELAEFYGAEPDDEMPILEGGTHYEISDVTLYLDADRALEDFERSFCGDEDQ